jgi:5-methylcytosine-specific restriction endonuclease McrA
MKCYSLTHLSDGALSRDLAAAVARDRVSTAELLAHIAEFDVRKLYVPAGYPSMFAYCVGELRLSENAALRRIRAARTARQFPALFPALADGRLNLNAVLLLKPHLTGDTVDDLLAAATHRTKRARRFPQPDVPARVDASAPTPVAAQLAPAPVEEHSGQLALAPVEEHSRQVALAPVGTGPLAVRQVEAPRDRVAPLSAGRFAVQSTLGQEGFDLLGYAQALLGHAVPSHDIAQVFGRALKELVHKLEQRKFAAAVRTRPGRRSANPRYVPAEIRRVVWSRDGGQCTFVAASGHRCDARTRLEFDHIDPVARGGQASANSVRLTCRAHNQYAAECAFGSEFMRHKRKAAQERSRETARAREATSASERARACEAASAPERAPATPTAAEDVIPWLRALGVRSDRARQAAAVCEGHADASLEARVKLALSSLAPASARRSVRANS